MFQARQGDIFFQEVKSFSKKGLKKKQDNVIAYGEVTGHSHKVTTPNFDDVEMYVDTNGDILITSDKNVVIEHDEHGSITLEANKFYHVSRQREYDPLAAEKERQVQD